MSERGGAPGGCVPDRRAAAMTSCLGQFGDAKNATSRLVPADPSRWPRVSLFPMTEREPSPPVPHRRLGSDARWPTGHVGWSFSGLGEFEGRATTFLAEGAAVKQRLVFVSDDPDPSLWPRRLLDGGDLVVASTSEAYGSERVSFVDSQRAAFLAMVAEALSMGFSGVRVVADCTSLIEGPERLQAWLDWEDLAEVLIGENPVTGLCAFDRTRADPENILLAMGKHQVRMPLD